MYRLPSELPFRIAFAPVLVVSEEERTDSTDSCRFRRLQRRLARLLEAVEHVAQLRLGGPGELRLLDAVDVELVPPGVEDLETNPPNLDKC